MWHRACYFCVCKGLGAWCTESFECKGPSTRRGLVTWPPLLGYIGCVIESVFCDPNAIFDEHLEYLFFLFLLSSLRQLRMNVHSSSFPPPPPPDGPPVAPGAPRGSVSGPLVPTGVARPSGEWRYSAYWAASAQGWCYPTGRCAYLPSVICYRRQ